MVEARVEGAQARRPGVRYLLDSNIVIDILNRRAHVKVAVERLEIQSSYDYCVNTIILAEVLAGLQPSESGAMETFLQNISHLDLAMEDARLAADFRRRYMKSHGLLLPDALIAATAVRHRLTLVTQNARHFPMPELAVHAL